MNINNWFTKKESLELNLSTATIVKLCILIIPIHGILYLSTFYENFGITYFMYFNPVDFLTIFYANNTIALKLLIGLMLFPVFLQILYRNKQDKMFYFNQLLSCIFLFSLCLVVIIIYNKPHLLYGILLLLFITTCVIIFAAISKKLSVIFPSLGILYLFFVVFFAKYDAYLTKINKPNFDIILNDNSYLLKEDKTKHSSYFIGNITNYIFIYDGVLKKVRATSIGEIKEIRFDYK
nr:hypothetical protein [uncultured Flavobacterium sp.]